MVRLVMWSDHLKNGQKSFRKVVCSGFQFSDGESKSSFWYAWFTIPVTSEDRTLKSGFKYSGGSNTEHVLVFEW